MPANIVKIVRYAVTFLLLISIGAYFWNNRLELRYLRDIHYGLFFSLILVILIAHIGSSLNFYIVLKRRHPDLAWIEYFKCYLYKRFYNMHIPQAGNVYEALRLKARFNIDISSYLSCFTLVNWLSASFICLVSMLVVVCLSLSGVQSGAQVLGMITVLLCLLSLAPLLAAYILHHVRLGGHGGYLGVIAAKVETVFADMKNYLLDRQIITGLLCFNLFLYLASVFNVYLSFACYGIHFGLMKIMPFVIINSMSRMVSILPGNIGMVEYAYGSVGAIAELAFGLGILTALLIRVANYLVFLIFFIAFKSKELIAGTAAAGNDRGMSP